MTKRAHKILIVDDEPVNRKLLEKLLAQNHNPISASSGQEAVEILSREDVSLLITDQQMPGMKGTELISLAREINPDMVCMLMSGVTDTGVFIDALTKSGAVRVINKPWKARALLQDIEAALDRYESFLESKQSIDRLKHATESMDRTIKSLK
ncbi:MAG TPA: response regulator [Blastocatellia bacterium]